MKGLNLKVPAMYRCSRKHFLLSASLEDLNIKCARSSIPSLHNGQDVTFLSKFSYRSFIKADNQLRVLVW